MSSPKHGERFRFQTLDPDGNAVHSGVAKRGEAGRFDAGWIGLERDLNIVLDIEQLPRILYQQRRRFRFHRTGRAAPKKDRSQWTPPKSFRLPREFPAQRVTEPTLRNDLANMRIEIAVRATRQAKRPV